MKKAGIAKQNRIKELKSVKLNECDQACQKALGCTSYEYNEKRKLCNLSNVTQLSNDLQPNDKDWDVYINNPG